MACVRKIREGKYRIDYRDDRGNRYRKFFTTRKAADDDLSTHRQELNTGTFVRPKDVPTFAEVARDWLETKRAGNYRPSTLQSWRTHLDNHLLHEEHGIGHLRLNKIDVPRVERFTQERRTAGVSPQTCNKILTTATAIFRFAVRHKKTVTNPAADAERLKVGALELRDREDAERTGVEVQEDEVLSPDELGRLLQNADEGFYRTLFQTTALTGARHDELLALMWSDFDFDAGKVTIRRSLSWAKVDKDDATQPRFFPPKTKAGRRTIDLPPELLHVLKVWKLQCPPGELDLVFPTPEGKPAHRSNVLRWGLYPALERAGLRRVHMHSLRHSFASSLIMAGEPPTRVANLLGHSSPAVTMRVYAHWFKDVKTEAVNNLAKQLFSPPQKPKQAKSA
ncbi:MAG: tyrosine-type recombinase/integrase [Candidatus Binatia bacterium]